MSKGARFEALASSYLHAQGVALLVDPALLRARGLGQIDVAIFTSYSIKIFEIKASSGARLSVKQRCRLRASGDFLAQVFAVSVEFRLWSEDLSVAF